jgi:uncharacterized protein
MEQYHRRWEGKDNVATTPAVDDRAAQPGGDEIVPNLIDCDVHPLVDDFPAFVERLSPRAAACARNARIAGGIPREHNRILHPTGGLRHDARTPSGGLPGSDPEFARQQLLEECGVTAAILVPIQAAAVTAWADEVAVAEYLRAMNDYYLERWSGADHRFKLAVSVSPHSGEAALTELERLVDHPDVVAVNLPLAEIAAGGSALLPLYEAAADLKLPVMIHPTGVEGSLVGVPTPGGGMVRTYPEHHAALAHSGQAVLTSLTANGVFARFPELRVVLTEYGFSWVPPLLWRMDAAWAADPDGSALERPPSEYVFENMRFTTQPLDEPDKINQLWEILEAVHAERTVLFSSDYPHWDFDDPGYVLRSRIPAHLRGRVGWENAADTFGDRVPV